MQKFSDMLGVNVNPRAFRRIVSTWARSHVSDFIRNSEPAALNHSSKVAQIHYAQNKAVAPQTLVQTYQKEENVFSKSMTESLAAEAEKMGPILKIAEEQSAQKRKKYLEEKDQAERKLKQDNRPLGYNYRIQIPKREKFEELMMEHGFNVKDLALKVSPIRWRKLILRQVTDPDSSYGSDLRDLWKEFYAGDLKNGIRDQRREVLGKNKGKVKSRNTYIAVGLKTAIQSSAKREAKNL